MEVFNGILWRFNGTLRRFLMGFYGGLMGFNGGLMEVPSGNDCYIAIENGPVDIK